MSHGQGCRFFFFLACFSTKVENEASVELLRRSLTPEPDRLLVRNPGILLLTQGLQRRVQTLKIPEGPTTTSSA